MSIENYGQHPTSYSNLSDEAFYANFRASRWEQLNDNSRIEALQEAVNRAATANGEIGSCTVLWDNSLSGSTYAVQGGDYIRINADRFMQGNDNNSRGEKMSDAGMQALEAALHEDQHAYQNQIIHDVIQAPSAELEREYKANDVIAVPLENGEYGSSYLHSSVVDYYMYYFQSTERDAFHNSQQRTREIMQQQAALIQNEIQQMNNGVIAYNPDAVKDLQAYAAYAENLASSGYAAQYRMASNMFAYDEFESDLNTALTNIYYNETRPLVDESMQASVQSAMQASYSPRMTIDHTHGTGAQHSALSSAPTHTAATEHSIGSDGPSEDSTLSTSSLSGLSSPSETVSGGPSSSGLSVEAGAPGITADAESAGFSGGPAQSNDGADISLDM